MKWSTNQITFTAGIDAFWVKVSSSGLARYACVNQSRRATWQGLKHKLHFDCSPEQCWVSVSSAESVLCQRKSLASGKDRGSTSDRSLKRLSLGCDSWPWWRSRKFQRKAFPLLAHWRVILSWTLRDSESMCEQKHCAYTWLLHSHTVLMFQISYRVMCGGCC